ncbi:unnamed protein product [Trifolium pratense]|uniref:Uncharacterized protein n=1 Tax=Trifolium pratense TaxID=57577 RepID=A0ACB0K5A1_TRIPR|nr:unnamed protein product [Trifolium pratense]
MFALGWGVDVEVWEWRRQLRAWEEEMLGSVSLCFLPFPCRFSSSGGVILRDRLPIKVNLVTRGALSSTAHSCVFGCGEAESAHHLFISCSFVFPLWDLVRSWIDIPLVEFTTLRDHFVQFTSLASGSRARRSFLQLIWLVCVWVVWTERNHRLYNGSTDTPHLLLDKIKLFSLGG